MPRFVVPVTRTDSFNIVVEAPDASAAVEKAYESDAFQRAPSLCAQCSGWGSSGPSVDGGEWDIDPDDVKQVEETR